MRTSQSSSALLGLAMLLLTPAGTSLAQTPQSQENDGVRLTCPQRYHEEGKFLANPDESVLIAAAIGWCRNNNHRLLWDERYAAVARKWSGFLVDSGEPDGKSLPLDRLRFELLQAGVTDAAILPYSSLGPGEKVPPGMLRFLDEQAVRGRYTHFAVGVTRSRNQKQMVTTLILGRRPARISPLPVCPAPAARMDLRMQLRRSYSHPRWLMTTPRGDVARGDLLYEEGFWFAEVALDAGRGEYTMEVVVNGPTGPEVAGLFPLYAGVERPHIPKVKARAAPVRYKNPDEAEAALLKLANGARERQKLPPLIKDDKLSSLARQHAMQLLFERHATHRNADTGVLTDRLRKAKVPFDRALENVSLSPSPEAAHDRFMDSPGHRVNVLDPNVTKVGVGVAMERTSSEDILAVCEVFVELPMSGVHSITIQKIHKMVNQRRRAKGRFALGLDNDLCRLARQSARRLSALNKAADPQSEGETVIGQLDEGGWGVDQASVRYFKTSDPGRVLTSREIYDESINRLGVGIARSADASRAGELWIALIFAGR